MPAGVHCVEALVAHARGDERALRLALGAFAISAGGPRTDVDVAFGRAGLLLGCTLLHEAPGIATLEEGGGIVALGNDLAAELTTILSDEAPGSSPSLPSLGAAHGWAGVLFALLRGHTVTGAPLPPALRTRLDELAALATPVGRGVCWPRTTERLPAEDGLRASWCNGSAGFVSLWLEAERSFGAPRYGGLAEAAGWTTFDAPPAGGDLCCGLAGRACAPMGLYRPHRRSPLVVARGRARRTRRKPYPDLQPEGRQPVQRRSGGRAAGSRSGRPGPQRLALV